MPDSILDGNGLGYLAEVNVAKELKVSIGSVVTTDINKLNVAPYLTDEWGNQRQMLCDTLFYGAPVVVDVGHHEIHCGDHFNYRDFKTIGSGIGSSINISLTTPNNTIFNHLIWDVEGTSQTEVRMWEGATLSGGVIISGLNNNRNMDRIHSMILKQGVTISGASPTSGLLLEVHSKGKTGTNPAAASFGANAGREDEWVLKSGTTYLFSITSADTGNIMDYSIKWYEHFDTGSII